MRKPLIGLVLLLAACQPMYGGAPAKMRNPAAIKPPKTLPVETATVIYDEDCELLTKPVKNPTRNSKRAEVLVHAADGKLADAAVATEAKTKGDLFIDGIDQYGAALTSDPFNATATLKLALAYNKVLRKGCALALLQRLNKLAENPKFADDANERIDEVTDNKKWFEGYRPAALKAVGR
jgi:hypothetical protein